LQKPVVRPFCCQSSRIFFVRKIAFCTQIFVLKYLAKNILKITQDGPRSVSASPEKKKMTNGHDHSSDIEDPVNPVIGGIWNQDLFFLSGPSSGSGDPVPKKGCKVMKPR
jgi:hypothetical protein